LIRIGRGVKPDVQLHWVIGLVVEFFWWGLFGGGPTVWFARSHGNSRKRR
jgi:hypothetical protein